MSLPLFAALGNVKTQGSDKLELKYHAWQLLLFFLLHFPPSLPKFWGRNKNVRVFVHTLPAVCGVSCQNPWWLLWQESWFQRSGKKSIIHSTNVNSVNFSNDTFLPRCGMFFLIVFVLCVVNSKYLTYLKWALRSSTLLFYSLCSYQIQVHLLDLSCHSRSRRWHDVGRFLSSALVRSLLDLSCFL